MKERLKIMVYSEDKELRALAVSLIQQLCTVKECWDIFDPVHPDIIMCGSVLNHYHISGNTFTCLYGAPMDDDNGKNMIYYRKGDRWSKQIPRER